MAHGRHSQLILCASETACRRLMTVLFAGYRILFGPSGLIDESPRGQIDTHYPRRNHCKSFAGHAIRQRRRKAIRRGGTPELAKAVSGDLSVQ